MCHNALRRLQHYVFRLNVFESGSTDEWIIKQEKLTTRIYLTGMVILLLISGGVVLTMERSITAYVSSPNQHSFQRLSNAVSSTLQCPCAQVATQFQTFTNIRFQLHQVCASSFVTEQWAQAISTDPDRLEMSFFWQIIAGLCRLSQSSIRMILDQFAVTALLTPTAIDEDLLRIQTQAAFDRVLLNTRSIFFRDLFAIQRVITGNQFVSGLATNFNARWSIVNGEWQPVLFDNVVDGCSCLNFDGCPRPSMSGIVSDCLMMNAVLQSSLQCYYNETCLTQLHPSMPLMSRLSPDNNHQSTMDSTVQDLLNRFMLDQLSIDVDFRRFYQECQPKYCTYSYRRRFDLLYTVTIMVGIFSGLKLVVRFLSPIVAKKFAGRRRVVMIQTEASENQNRSTRIRWLAVPQKLWQSMSSLNLYASRIPNDEHLPRQRLTTRAFILIMAIALIVSGVYIFFAVQTQVITVPHPSLEIYERLYDNYSSTLSCPCSQISVPQARFLTINYTLHQICSSSLVSSAWLKLTLELDQSRFANSTRRFFIDFRRLAPSYFQLVAAVCSLIHNIFDDALGTLGETHFINQYLPSQSQFLEQMSSLNQSLTTSLKQEFLGVQNWLYLIATQSQLLIGVSINGGLAATHSSGMVQITEKSLGLFGQVTETAASVRGVCSCRRIPRSCQIVSTLEAISVIQSYPTRNFVGMNAGCVPWLGLLATNIAWWYRADIIEQIRLLFGDHLRHRSDPIITSLSNQTQTKFRYRNGSYLRFEDILAEALLEEWTGDLTRFDLFYDECAPKECTYLIQSQRARLAAFLLLVSICGGLNQLLRWFTLILFLIVSYVRNTYRQRRDQGRCHIIEHIRRSLMELNLYRSTVTDQMHVRRERLQTRIYIGLLSISVLILVIYTSLEERAVVETLQPPNNATEYEAFREQYGETLECACTRISLEYKSLVPLLQVESFHPVCNSSFVDGPWLTYLFPAEDLPSYIPNEDFRQWMLAFFRLLISLCSSASDQIGRTLLTFSSSSVVISRLIPPMQFEQQMNTALRHLQQQIPAQFAQAVDLIRLSYQGNALISVFSSNWRYLVQNNNRSDQALLSRRPVTYENGTCSCAVSHQCSTPATLYDDAGQVFHTVSAVRLGCSILESVLQSSLECFYSLECVDSLTGAFPRGQSFPNYLFMIPPGTFSVIDDSFSTFAIDDTVEAIVNRMFINRWVETISYDGFFQGCAPEKCSYTRHYRFDTLELITTFLSVFGGLSAVLRFLVPHVVDVINKIRPMRRIDLA